MALASAIAVNPVIYSYLNFARKYIANKYSDECDLPYS